MNNIILDNKVGLFNAPGDAVTLADNIEYCYKNPSVMAEMKKQAYALTARLGDSDIVYNNVLDFIEQTAAKKTT
jgi:long-subunit fatty acid transport protein